MRVSMKAVTIYFLLKVTRKLIEPYEYSGRDKGKTGVFPREKVNITNIN